MDSTPNCGVTAVLYWSYMAERCEISVIVGVTGVAYVGGGGGEFVPHALRSHKPLRSAEARWISGPRGCGYEVSQRKRKAVEQSFGWMKMVGTLKKVKLRGIDKVGWLFTFTGAAYNLCRLRT
jgi:hypothetical protein